MNVGYNQNPFLMQATAAATPPTAPPATTTTAGITGSIPQQPPQQLTKTKRILSIVDPMTNEVTNKDHIIRSEKEQQQMMQQNVENTDTGKFNRFVILSVVYLSPLSIYLRCLQHR